MSQISSINFKKSKGFQTKHNDRKIPPSYLLQDGGYFEVNRNSQEALKLKNTIIQDAINAYTEKRGQKFQAKCFEWSAVCNIKPETTMDDLKKLAKHFSDKYGFQCYQIAIHRDEGYTEINEDTGEKETHINHHAHLEFITLDKETGKNRQRELGPAKLRQIQTETAQILQMERGIDKRLSGAKRIEPRAYAALKEKEKNEQRRQRANLKAQELQTTQEIQTLKIELSKANSLIWQKDTQTENLNAENLELQERLFAEKFKTKEQKSQIIALETQNQSLKAQNLELKEILISQKEVKAEFEKLRKIMIEWGFCDKDDYKFRTESLQNFLKNSQNKKYSQADLDQAILQTKKAIKEKHSLETQETAQILTQKDEVISNLTQELKTQGNALKREIEKNGDLERKISTLEFQKNEYEKRYQDLKDYLNSNTNKDQAIKALASELEQEKQKNNTLRAENYKLRVENEELKAKNAESELQEQEKQENTKTLSLGLIDNLDENNRPIFFSQESQTTKDEITNEQESQEQDQETKHTFRQKR